MLLNKEAVQLYYHSPASSTSFFFFIKNTVKPASRTMQQYFDKQSSTSQYTEAKLIAQFIDNEN